MKNRIKKSLIRLNIIFLLSLLFLSCGKDERYYDLTIEAKSLISFDNGETFELKNITTDETISFTIDNKEFFYVEDQNPGNWLTGAGTDDYYETGTYNFSDNNNCYSGYITIKATSNNDFEFSVFTSDCFGEYLTTFEFNSLAFEYNSEITSIIINNIEYPETYILNSRNNTMFYTKDNGIIQIVDDVIESEIFEIVE